MDRLPIRDTRMPAQGRRARHDAAQASEADLAMRLLVAALFIVLAAVVAASAIVRLGEYRTSEAPSAGACVRLADAERCATRTEVADRLILSRASVR